MTTEGASTYIIDEIARKLFPTETSKFNTALSEQSSECLKFFSTVSLEKPGFFKKALYSYINTMFHFLPAKICEKEETINLEKLSIVTRIPFQERGSSNELCMLAYLFDTMRVIKNEFFGRISEQDITLAKEAHDALCAVSASILKGFSTTTDLLTARVGFLRLLLEKNITPEDLSTFIAYVTDSEELEEVFNPILDMLKNIFICQELCDNFDEYIILSYNCVINLINVTLPDKSKPICDIIVRRPDFLYEETETKASARETSTLSFLGAFLSFGMLSDEGLPETPRKYYDVKAYPENDECSILHKSYHNRLLTMRRHMHTIVHTFIVYGSTRSRTLNWFEHIIEKNSNRAKMRATAAHLCNDNFICNFLWILFELSQKIAVGKVNVFYPFQDNSRVDLKEETRIKMNSTEAKSFADSHNVATSEDNFSTECFFLTVHATAIGLKAIKSKLETLRMHEMNLTKTIESLEESQKKNPDTNGKAQLRDLKKRMLTIVRTVLCYECFLRDDNLLHSGTSFTVKQLSFIMKVLNVPQHDDGNLPENAPETFQALPEFYVEEPLDFLSHILKTAPKLVFEEPYNWGEHFIALACRINFFNNPNLKKKIVEVIAMISPAYQPGATHVWNQMANTPLAINHLLPCLVKFYADAEVTDFMYKFPIRRHMHIIFKCLWERPLYRSNMIEIGRASAPEYIRFINMIINDTTYLMDESLAALKKIHDIEGCMENADEWNKLSSEEKSQKESMLDSAKHDARTWLSYCWETLEFLQCLTKDSPESFHDVVLGERLAAMLNNNLQQLCGKKCTELKVKDAKTRFEWEPRKFAGKVIEIYVNLNSSEFAKCIANDERSYSPLTMSDILAKMVNHNIVNSSHFERFRNLTEMAAKHYNEKESVELELEYDDAPEEYKDPVMATIMENPVRLPSGHIMDEKVIMRHLLSNETNPFNRAPLFASDLTPLPDLKAEIQNWIKTKLGR
ncbi:unnamed protein product [Auanema sp. JU1783]|nr:unnamed protein product [Auanema sp. JU1783]